MRNTWWDSGNYNTICDVCGFKYKATGLRKRWDGLMVCMQDWEIRHPQELIRPIPDQNKVPWTRPEGTDQFVGPALESLSGTILAGTTSIVVTVSGVTSASKILYTGQVPNDPKGVIGAIVPSTNTVTINAAVAPLNNWTIYFNVVG